MCNEEPLSASNYNEDHFTRGHSIYRLLNAMKICFCLRVRTCDSVELIDICNKEGYQNLQAGCVTS